MEMNNQIHVTAALTPGRNNGTGNGWVAPTAVLDVVKKI
jgi:hypothetical protein